MDVNYSRWMSKDPDAEPEAIEDEPRRFSIPRPARSIVASGALVALVALGGGAYVRSITTAPASADQTQAVETPTDSETSGPGAAAVDESVSDDSTSADTTADDWADDEPSPDSGEIDDGSTTSDVRVPAGSLPMDRREFRRAHGIPPGGLVRDRPLRVHRYVDDSSRPAPPPPAFRH
jgi:hypothetical protein